MQSRLFIEAVADAQNHEARPHQMPGSLFTCFGIKKTPPPPANSVVGEAKRMSQDAARAAGEDDFALRVEGFDDDDAEIKAIKEEREKRRSQDMEAQAAKRKSQEEAFVRRLSGL